jgi:hypothetical protein
MATVYERIVARAFDVPDVLTDENQVKAAAAALLLLADFNPDRAHRDGYELVAAHNVSTLATMLEQHELDSTIGGYSGGNAQGSAKARLVNAVFNHLSREPDLPSSDDQRHLASHAIDRVVDWIVRHPDAVHDFSQLRSP